MNLKPREIRCLVFREIPDSLADHSLLFAAPEDRLRELCRRWTSFVGSLWDRRKTQFSLRFIREDGSAEPQLTVALLIRKHAGTSSTELDQAVDLLQRRLLRQGLSSEQIHEFSWALTCGFRDGTSPTMFQVYQEPIQLGGTEATQYLGQSGRAARLHALEPWWGPGGTFQRPAETVATTSCRAAIVVDLRPVEITREHWERLEIIAKTGLEQAARFDRRAQNTEGQRRVDPQAELAGETARLQLRRLRNPFEIAVHTLAEAPKAAGDLAHELAGMIFTEEAFEIPAGASSPQRSGARVVELDPPAALRAFDAISEVEMALPRNPYYPDNADSVLDHLVSLVDARGAATVFRFPVSTGSGIQGIEIVERAPDFATRCSSEGDDNIDIGWLNGGGIARVPLHELTRHTLITGFTGSGKTNTVLFLLHQLQENGIPFLVVESAKAEYRGLLSVRGGSVFRRPTSPEDQSGFRVYTLGNELCSPFRLNPFELLPGVRLETHIARLQTCFSATLDQEGPLPSLLADALSEIYEDLGWQLTDVGVRAECQALQFPTLACLERKLLKLLGPKSHRNPRGRGYQGEVLANVSGFVGGRVSPLLRGSKGKMFNCQRSSPSAEALFECPTVLELNDLGSTDKSLVVLFVLTLLREYRDLTQQKCGKGLRHVTVIEEAHNVLANETSNQASTTAASTKQVAMESICNMLAEVRSLGEGIVLSDQSPEKLARDAIKNTNVQIVHQLKEEHDREAIGSAMLMSDAQQDFVGKLRCGRAALFRSGMEKATFVEVPCYDQVVERIDERPPLSGLGVGFTTAAPDRTVARHMHLVTQDVVAGPFDAACQECSQKCRLRPFVVKGIEEGEEILKATHQLLRRDPSIQHREAQLLDNASRLAMHSEVPISGPGGRREAVWCAWLHLVDRAYGWRAQLSAPSPKYAHYFGKQLSKWTCASARSFVYRNLEQRGV